MKKIILLLILLIPFNTYALELKAKSSILIEASTNKILYENNKDEKLPPASMTKMMVMLITMEKLNDGVISLDDMVTVSEGASHMGGSQVYLEANQKYKLDNLLKAVSVASANDAAYALAEHISGSIDEFVKLMNEKVNELGLKNTQFVNVHGLDEEGHYSSAYDMAIIASNLLKYESILKYTSVYEDYINHPNGSNTWIVNTNKFVFK